MLKIVIIAGVIVLAACGSVVGALRYIDSRPAAPAEIRCTGDGDQRVIVIGDSWAGGKLDRGMAATLGADFRICSLGYSGATTEEVAGAAARDLPKLLTELGGEPQFTVIMAGLNDAITQRGPSYYIGNLTRLAAFLPGKVVAVEMPWFNPAASYKGMTDIVTRPLLSCVYAGCAASTVADYRRASSTSGLTFIPYEPFAAQYEDADYSDGVHLTPERYDALASYVATAAIR